MWLVVSFSIDGRPNRASDLHLSGKSKVGRSIGDSAVPQSSKPGAANRSESVAVDRAGACCFPQWITWHSVGSVFCRNEQALRLVDSCRESPEDKWRRRIVLRSVAVTT